MKIEGIALTVFLHLLVYRLGEESILNLVTDNSSLLKNDDQGSYGSLQAFFCFTEKAIRNSLQKH
ncbi:hypothetical protein Bhyg_08414 [Pseudolycoriella hygida]|uniref:Uncharacterized protein n=1 Tax=Pseudolycoriella hygida TaxID=35572 RepID=A0A9Q0S4C0_9DIPT|nr:hypothetical protein Bhyg_08414 [Pseudolycoriella hygida]